MDFLVFFLFPGFCSSAFRQVDHIAFCLGHFIALKFFLKRQIHFGAEFGGGLQVVFAEAFTCQKFHQGILPNVEFLGCC